MDDNGIGGPAPDDNYYMEIESVATSPRPTWWSTFWKVLAVVGAWHVIPVLAGLTLFVNILRGQSRQCVDCHAYDGLIVIGIGLVLAASAIISLILATATAFFRPRRPFLFGNLAAITGIAVTAYAAYAAIGDLLLRR